MRLDSGVRPVSGDRLFFPFSGSTGTGSEYGFEGIVRFSGHAGMLCVILKQPCLLLNDDFTRGELKIGEKGCQRSLVTFNSRFSVKRGFTVLIGENVELCPESVDLFGNNYTVGERFDDFLAILSEGVSL